MMRRSLSFVLAIAMLAGFLQAGAIVAAAPASASAEARECWDESDIEQVGAVATTRCVNGA